MKIGLIIVNESDNVTFNFYKIYKEFISGYKLETSTFEVFKEILFENWINHCK